MFLSADNYCGEECAETGLDTGEFGDAFIYWHLAAPDTFCGGFDCGVKPLRGGAGNFAIWLLEHRFGSGET